MSIELSSPQGTGLMSEADMAALVTPPAAPSLPAEVKTLARKLRDACLTRTKGVEQAVAVLCLAAIDIGRKNGVSDPDLSDAFMLSLGAGAIEERDAPVPTAMEHVVEKAREQAAETAQAMAEEAADVDELAAQMALILSEASQECVDATPDDDVENAA